MTCRKSFYAPDFRSPLFLPLDIGHDIGHTVMSIHGKHLLCILFTTLLLLVSSVSAPAQMPSADIDGDPYINVFAAPGAATVTVNVWGAVSRPGLWRVEKGVDLIKFLSVTGLAGIGQTRPGTRTKTFVSIYRNIDGVRREVYRSDVEDILGDGATYPVLEDDDVLGVETIQRRSLGFQTASLVVGTASSLASLAFLIIRN